MKRNQVTKDRLKDQLPAIKTAVVCAALATTYCVGYNRGQLKFAELILNNKESFVELLTTE